MNPLPPDTAVIVVDHGSRLDAANAMLLEIVQVYREITGSRVVEPAHMELAEPTLDEAAARCVAQGATTIVVHPYFLAPGRHSTGDIPRMVAAVAPRFPGVRFAITEPLGIDPALAQVMHRRVVEALPPV